MHEYLSNCKGVPPLPKGLTYKATVIRNHPVEYVSDGVTYPVAHLRIGIWDDTREISYAIGEIKERLMEKYPHAMDIDIPKIAKTAYNYLYAPPAEATLAKVEQIALNDVINNS